MHMRTDCMIHGLMTQGTLSSRPRFSIALLTSNKNLEKRLACADDLRVLTIDLIECSPDVSSYCTVVTCDRLVESA
jgi:hypothetical protein